MTPIKRCTTIFRSLVIAGLMTITTASLSFAQEAATNNTPPSEIDITNAPNGEPADMTGQPERRLNKRSEEMRTKKISKSSELQETQTPKKTKKNEMAVGLAYGLLHVPIDGELETNGSPMNLFFDFDCIFIDGVKWRVGYNTTKSKLEFDAYNKTWLQEYNASSLYLAYRGVNKLSDNLRLVALVGLDYVSAEVKTTPGSSSTKGTGFGGRIGIGTYYYIGGIGLGLQYELNSASVAFNDVNIDMGGNQLQAVATLSF